MLEAVEQIAALGEKSGMSPEYIKKCEPHARIVARFFGCSDLQAILLSLMCNLGFNRESVDMDDMANFLKCTPISMLKYMGELEELCSMRILRHDSDVHVRKGRRMRPGSNAQFYVSKEAVKSLTYQESFASTRREKLDLYGFIDVLGELFSEREENRLTYEELVAEIKSLMDANLHQGWIRELSDMFLDKDSLCIFLYTAREFVNDRPQVDLSDMVKMLFHDLRTQMRVRREFNEGRQELILRGLAEVEDGFFRSDRNICLTARGAELVLKEDSKLIVKMKKKPKDILLASEVVPKRLIFHPEEEQKLKFLTSTLRQGNFKRLTGRLKKAGMKQGVAILMYGPPGTGKTESAYQIARKTGRDIMQVVISETKSMWFGESEKLIKGVFDKYRKLVESSEIAPILLFNEADAIFSTRKKIGSSSVDQTENAIQNIILQEMEDLNGILIATTNLTGNLDQAFERRFLYKIRFEKPSREARSLMWMDKIPSLHKEEIIELAKRYELTGGQIDNVARKCISEQVLHGTLPAKEFLFSFCEEESLGGMRGTMVGFKYQRDKSE